MLLQAAHFPTRNVSGKAACQEVVLLGDDIDLGKLPILQCWSEDAGRFITLPIVINKSADGKLRNVGLYRMQVFDAKSTGMHWHIHKDGAHFFHEFKRQNKTMQVAVAIGADPVVCYAASAPLPYGIDEFLLAGFIRKQAVPLVKCKTVDLEVPANAEIVLEGTIEPEELRTEGPFGDHTGYYSQDGDYPVFRLSAITHRRDPVYLTTIVGKPPQEDFYLGKATERIFLPLMRTQLPEIVDINMPVEGVFHNSVIVSIKKRYPMQARRMMSALWGMGQMSFVKTIVVVDENIDVQNIEQVANALLNEVDVPGDLFFSEGVLDVLNHGSDQALYGSKVGIDLTQKIAGEAGFGKQTPPAQPAAAKLPEAQAILRSFPELAACRLFDARARLPMLFVALKKDRPGQCKDFIDAFWQDPEWEAIAIVIVLEGHVDVHDTPTVMWKFFNNLDPRRDFHFNGSRLAINVTQKLPEEGYEQNWPREIEMSDSIKTQVDGKWNLYFNK
jgi:4-hydroxy-3-polyprenylbenzoate decarboxylase